MSKKLPVNGFKWIDNNEINEKFIKNCNENNDTGYILEVDIKYPKRLHELHSDLPFLSERIKIDKCNKLVCNLFNKKKYVTHKFIETSVKSWIKVKKVHRVIEFNQKEWLKPYIDMNTELRKQQKMILKKIFLN